MKTLLTNQLAWIGRLCKVISNFFCRFYISGVCVHAKGNCSHALSVIVSSTGQTSDSFINLFSINVLNLLLFQTWKDKDPWKCNNYKIKLIGPLTSEETCIFIPWLVNALLSSFTIPLWTWYNNMNALVLQHSKGSIILW